MHKYGYLKASNLEKPEIEATLLSNELELDVRSLVYFTNNQQLNIKNYLDLKFNWIQFV